MKIKKTRIPGQSLTGRFLPADYTDSFSCEVESRGDINADDIMISLWTDMPGAVKALFKVHNFLVKIVGLKGGNDHNTEELEKCIRMGGEYGLVSVPAKDTGETVMKLSDKHLDAYMSVMVGDYGGKRILWFSTLVHYHNKLGWVYFFLIRPFHGIVVRKMVKRGLQKILQNRYY